MDRDAAFAYVQEIAADLSQGNVVFPTSFDTTMRLRELLRSENSSMADVAAVVMLDPLLASKVMQAANSVALNPNGSKVLDVKTAVMRIGASSVRAMAIALAMQQLRTYREMTEYAHLSDGFMRHSRRVAALAFVLAREHSRLRPDTAMFAGLVHDIGLFYLLYQLGARSQLPMAQADLTEVLRDWHASIGHAVLSALGVPEDIQDAVANHDEPRRLDSIRDLGDLIFVANLVSQDDEICRRLMEGPEAEQVRRDVREFEQYQATAEACAEEVSAIMTSL